VDSTLSLGDLLPAAVGIALSPIPVAAVIVMLFSSRARVNGAAFVAGWITGLALVGGVLLVLGGDRSGSSEEPSTTSLWVKTGLGLLLLAAAVWEWRRRPGSGEEAVTPRWMEAVDSFSAPKAFGLALVLSGLNPKNLALNAAGVLVVLQSGLQTGEQWIAFGVFVLLASLTVMTPVAYYYVAGDRADRFLESLKTSLIRHNVAVMSVLLLIFGVKLLADGLQGLLG
jgi:hypothetical protein